jgi:septal ring factor EnvC (AmiA/AmiB activator)
MKRKKTSTKIKLLFLIAVFSVINFNILGGYAFADDDVEDVQEDIEKYEEKAEKTEKELNNSKALLQKNQASLNLTKNLIQKTLTEIERKEAEIENLSQKIELDRKILENYLLEAYFHDQDPFLDIVLDDKEISSISENFDQMIGVKEKMLSLIEEIKITLKKRKMNWLEKKMTMRNS